MNAGIPASRRSVQHVHPAPASTRPRSPDTKTGATRARSPPLSKPADRVSGATGSKPAIPSGSATSPALGTSPPQVSSGAGGRGLQQQQSAVRRGTSSTVEEIKRIDANREQRRRQAEEVRRTRQEEALLLGQQCGGNIPDIDFHRMIKDFRSQCPPPASFEPVDPSGPDGISVCVRKRPISQHELSHSELDCVTALNPYAIIHERKFKVDGITKCLESHQFEFDRVFDEASSTEDVYGTVAGPLVPWVLEHGGRATLFAYGQTGSGKTHTMTGIQRLLAEQLFDQVRHRADLQLEVSVSFFEIYGGRPYDLLNNRQRLETLEDAKNEVQIAGLTERGTSSPEAMLQCIELGNSLRTTHATAINRDSSRSHAVCAVFLRQAGGGGIHGKVTLVDLAGSERAADSKSSIRQRRVEGAQINKSLLALKECIRAMGQAKEAHVPFRASKLTLVLRDAFVSRCPARTVMIACISPGMSSADHSVNTLRYSDRLKEHPRGGRPITEEGGDGTANRRTSMGMPARDSKSPEPRQQSRRRSPSPQAKVEPAPAALSNKLGQRARAAAVEPPKDDTLPFDSEEDSEEDLEDQLTAQNPALLSGASQSAPATSSTAWAEASSRQQPSRGARQPLPRAREGGGPSSAESTKPTPPQQQHQPQPQQQQQQQQPQQYHPQQHHHQPPHHPQQHQQQHQHHHQQPHQTGRAQAATSSTDPAAKAPDLGGSRNSDIAVSRGGGSDLLQQDNRYLHNTLTSEVYERHGAHAPASIVDVGVEDLNDLAHMEVAEEVRQWEDRIVSQHMVALQEDARLLTKESELLSQVQQGASYDIDWYVSEVDKVVRRKIEVYMSFMEDLEAFKAQLKREESLSRSCQRGAPSGGPPAGQHQHVLHSSIHGVSGASPRGYPDRDSASQMPEGTPQRTPRTPRLATNQAVHAGAPFGVAPMESR
eukprot:TRINITY_DN15267_c0_g1_i1.p1 TRINITY_DN15267_c0_g1~~TRINITY_DN15267_c0_g1_i1.p1  ORF type:complete len:938 (+),score=162.02 TRINITY_DN15267_c0_g1_i1:112-2925(+)